MTQTSKPGSDTNALDSNPTLDATDGFLFIWQAHREALLRVLVRMLGTRENAEDVAQETWIRASRADVPTISNPRAYLFRIAQNLARDRLRQERVRSGYMAGEPLPDDVTDETPDIERVLVGRETLRVLTKAVDELPPRCREVFILRRFKDLGQDEIASRLGISRNMVEKHLRHALLHCARRLKEGR